MRILKSLTIAALVALPLTAFAAPDAGTGSAPAKHSTARHHRGTAHHAATAHRTHRAPKPRPSKTPAPSE